MYYSAPFRKFCPIFVFRVRDPGFRLYLYGTRAHFSLKNAKGWPPLSSLLSLSFFPSLSLSNCMALFVITACVMRAGQNGIADKSQGTNRRDQPDKVWLDIRAYESNNLTPSLFSRGSRDWRVLRFLPFLWSSSPPAIRFPSGQQPAEEHGGLRGVRRGGRSSKYFRDRKEATSVTLPRVCSGGDENNAR